ncbi:Bacterial Ig domain-containing protein OS=Streptomyces lavendulae subsp. lavendulae OX=58340 GN=SLAV_03865 PE=4 SV=1 [Streptomyces lavendulae subsp. lavendulae]
MKAGDQVIFIGRTKGLKVGSKLVLQHLNNGKWTTLQSGTTVKNGSSYTLPGKLNTKGKEQLRIMGDDKTVSPTVVVTVS